MGSEPDGSPRISSKLQENGNIAGAVLCGSDGRYGYIHYLAVSKAMRKQGIGKSLVEGCIRFLQR
jgi:ribosomal protein S18 acetylase RimI-like enzyme